MKSMTMEPKPRQSQVNGVFAPIYQATDQQSSSISEFSPVTSQVPKYPNRGHSFANVAVLSPTQATISPAAVSLQTKLKVNEPGDQYEQEADRIAEQVMRMPDPRLQRQCSCGTKGGECAECKKKNDSGTMSAVQHSPLVVPNLQRNATASSPHYAPPSVHAVLNTPGQPLDQSTRDFFEPRFGRDLSHVRIHTDDAAARSAEDVQARAYTVGSHVAFGEGFHRNMSIVAHELVHVIQQGERPTNGYGMLTCGSPELFRTPDPNSPHPEEDECINLTRIPDVTCPQLLACIEYLFERLEIRAEDLFVHKGGDHGHKLRFGIVLVALQELISLYLSKCNTSDYVWETERVREVKERLEQIQQRKQTQENEKLTEPTGHGIPDWVWTALGATAAALLVACFATGVCEVGAIVAGVSALSAELIIAALEFGGILVVRNPQLLTK